MAEKQQIFRVRASGELACFTRPEMKVERVSYEVMTPSAARGILESILWKPAISWRVHAIEVLAPIRWMSFRRNEVSKRATKPGSEIYVDESKNRAQRNTVALRDVDYVIEASIAMTEQAGPDDSRGKFEAMFERRLSKGQHFNAPYFGCREFAARVEPAPDSVIPIDPGVERPLGMMFYDFRYVPAPVTPFFFSARLVNGRLAVPAPEAVMDDAGGES